MSVRFTEQGFMSRVEFEKELRCRYQEGRLALFVGAGVSVSCGLPDWKTLAGLVVDEAVPVDPRLGQPGHVRAPVEHYKRLYIKELPPVEALRAVRNFTGASFTSIVSRSLYKRAPVASDTAKSIVQLSRVSKICIFNYDDIIQNIFREHGRNFKTVTAGSSFSFLDEECLIFHPHGFLPQAPNEAQASSDIVLSEDDYHKLYASPYTWANIIQINLLMNYSVLFVGFSLTDPNTRRLLDIVRATGSDHRQFAILLDPTLEIKKREAHSWFPSNHAALAVAESSLQSRGVYPIWIDSHDGISKVLNKVAGLEG